MILRFLVIRLWQIPQNDSRKCKCHS